MKKLFRSKKMVFILILILYILSQVAGTLAIRSFFLNYKIKELAPRLDYISNEIGKGDYQVSINNDFILKAYDISGNEINIFKDKVNDKLGVKNDAISNSLEKYIETVSIGENIEILKEIGNQDVDSIVIGRPIIKADKIIGAIFLLKPASDFNAVLNGFYIIFLITLLIGILIITVVIEIYFKESLNLEKMRRDYIANVSHELKSPISSIKALTETLIDDMIQDEETKLKYYGIIIEESNKLQKLVIDMLELSKIQDGRLDFSKKEICGVSLIQEIYEKYKLILSDMDYQIEITDRALNLPNLYTNRDRIIQIVTILMDNSIKFLVDKGKITIDAKIYSNSVIIIISDNGIGIGIEDERLPYIFDRFYKGEGLNNKSGSGLGLSIAKEIIEGLNEKIWVSSELGMGTIFSFSIQRISEKY